MSESDPIMAKTRRVYREQAQTYDQVRRRDGVERPWLGRFTTLLPAKAQILDLGCGNGEPFSKTLIEMGFALTGVDFSPELLAIAQARFPEGLWVEQDLRHLDVREEPFDGILCWGVMFHLTQRDQRRLIHDMKAHLKPDGALMMTIGDTAGESEGFVGETPVYHASLSIANYRKTLDQAGFEIIDLTIRDESCGGATVVLARKSN